METKGYKTHRRGFLGLLTGSAAALSISGLMTPLSLKAYSPEEPVSLIPSYPGDADAWFNKVKGKHRIVYDTTKPNDLFPFAWAKVFLLTNQMTGTTTNECGVVIVLRHNAIPFAFEDRIWEKYKFGDVFSAPDPKTKASSIRNPFWEPQPGDFKIPGIGEVAIGIKDLQKDGVMFCVCNMAITVFSAVVADMMKMQVEDVKKDWMSALIPGIQVVPSGVWAVGRAQEHSCAYCYAG